ncbi:MAG: hypothetical protein WCP34_15230 [Pseudomonadota bacterium]
MNLRVLRIFVVEAAKVALQEKTMGERVHLRFIDLPLHLGRDGFTPSTRKCQTMDGVKPSLPSRTDNAHHPQSAVGQRNRDATESVRKPYLAHFLADAPEVRPYRLCGH